MLMILKMRAVVQKMVLIQLFQRLVWLISNNKGDSWKEKSKETLKWPKFNNHRKLWELTLIKTSNQTSVSRTLMMFFRVSLDQRMSLPLFLSFHASWLTIQDQPLQLPKPVIENTGSSNIHLNQTRWLWKKWLVVNQIHILNWKKSCKTRREPSSL